MLHFGKIPKKIGQNLAKIRQIWQNLQKFNLQKKQQKIQQFLTKN
jgi:hypothetical protein